MGVGENESTLASLGMNFVLGKMIDTEKKRGNNLLCLTLNKCTREYEC